MVLCKEWSSQLIPHTQDHLEEEVVCLQWAQNTHLAFVVYNGLAALQQVWRLGHLVVNCSGKVQPSYFHPSYASRFLVPKMFPACTCSADRNTCEEQVVKKQVSAVDCSITELHDETALHGGVH